MNRSILLSVLIIILLIVITLFSRWIWVQSKPTLPPTPAFDARTETPLSAEIEQVIRDEIELRKAGVPVMLLYDTRIDQIMVSSDGNWASARITPVDPTSGEIVPTEPGLVILNKEAGQWQAIFPSDHQWLAHFQAAPDEIIPPGDINTQLVDFVYDASALDEPYTGYYLPWAGGATMALTQSVGHDRYTPSGNAHYAFDFAMQGYPSGMFNVHAARSGTVKQAVWIHENGNETSGNYLVIEDTSTEPTTYQLYLHFAKDSIPAALRVVGAPVVKGQFIGIADDTGISSGNHLHFMVHTNPASYWGRSVDITFNDVSINGGRPRISSDLPYCWDTDICNQTQYLYVSGNYISPDHTPPTGSLIMPVNGATASTGLLPLKGWAVDDISGISSAQFQARYNGSWREINGTFTTATFSTQWDLCSDQVPDGPISLALDLWDRAFNHNGNLPGLRHITKNYDCPTPPPACNPTSNQIALFASYDYQGECTILNTGNHTSPANFGSLGINNAESIQVGSNVQATLYKDPNLHGRGETFTANDSNLKDNSIGANTVESVIVQLRGSAPAIPVLRWPAAGATFKDDASFYLAWDDSGGAIHYQAQLLINGDPVSQSDWVQNSYWHISSLAPGNYSWQVRGRNSAGTSVWSSTRGLVIQEQTADPPATVTAPFEDDMEALQTLWTRSSFWDRNRTLNHTPGGEISWFYDTNTNNGYDTGEPNSGYLTSPQINLPAAGAYSLRFWYYYETEGPDLHWDQRWVQLSVNGGEYFNLLQLSDDIGNYWLHSPEIELGEFAGQTIQVRFYFATIDDAFNQYKGWYIDDFTITNSSGADCDDGNDGFVDAPTITYNTSIDGVICPSGDIDYYRFQGIAGDQIGVHLQAEELSSELDSYLYLLDIDGRSILAENDDMVYAQKTDSWLTYRLRRTGTYYLKIRSWNHPTSGDVEHFYRLNLYKDQADPQARFIAPADPAKIPPQPIQLVISAQDSGSGVSRVQFLWHSADWKNTDWTILGDDWNPQDGWNYTFDASSIPDPSGIAFYARVFDWAGNWVGVGSWSDQNPNIFLPIIVK